MPRDSAEEKRIVAEVLENLIPDWNQSPSQMKYWYYNNIINPSLSINVGMTDSGRIKIVGITDAKALKVASVGSSVGLTDLKVGTAGSTQSGAVAMNFVTNKIRVLSTDYDFLFYPSPDGVQFQEPIYIFAGMPFQEDLVVTSFKVQRAGNNDASYRVEGLK